MAASAYNVLFLCTGNSARSVMAEVLLNQLGQGRFRAFSAGSHPTGKVNPFTLELLQANGHATESLRSKSWDEFAAAGAPRMDFIITVCDNAAGEVCPVWPGQPVSAHWGFEDPAAAQGSDEAKRAKFAEVYGKIARRVRLLRSLPLDTLDPMTWKKQLQDIGRVS
ncbi:MAG TPA: arsenate reductase ArsC [Burkholderiales bacterium]|nr:arsenate reductase ArsC [Burkholderiales bacterium]